MKRTLRILCCLVMALSVAMGGCSSGTSPSSQAESSSAASTPGAEAQTTGGDVTLRYNWWGAQKRHDMTMEAIGIFEEKNPGIKIEPVFGTYDGYFDKLNVEIAGGNAPDLFTFDLWTLATYTKNGSTLCLQPYVDEGKLMVDDIDQSVLDGASIDGDLYALTTGSLATGIIYDAQIFEDLGINPPDNGWTWDDFRNICREVTEKSDGKYFGCSDLSGEMMFVEFWVRQDGISHFTDGLLTEGVEQSYASWFKMWEEMRAEGIIPSAEATVNEGWQMEQRAISLGNAAMDMNSTNKVATYESVMVNQGNTLEIVSVPHKAGEKRDGGFVQPSMFIAVSSGTKYPEEAVKFINYYASDIDSAKALGYDRGVQVNAKFREEMTPLLSETDARMNEFISYASTHYSPMDGLFPKAYEELRASFLKTSQAVAFEKSSIEESCSQFVKDANKTLENDR